MAELTATPADTTTSTSSCCSTEAQATCCEPSDKDACCGDSTAGGSCGCSAGQKDEGVSETDNRETVRERYAAAARAASETQPASCGCGTSSVSTTDETGLEVFGSALYDESQTEGATPTAVAASLGCGVPTAVADLHEG